MNKCKTLETIYDRYVPVVYGIALKYSSSISEAEKIVCDVFINLKLEDLKSLKSISIMQFLVSETIVLCRKEKRPFNLNDADIEKESLVNKIMFQKRSIEDLCNDKNKSRAELFKEVRNEFQSRS